LFAAALDERIKAVATTGALLSYRPAMQEIHDSVELYNIETSELVTAHARVHYSLFVPGMLKVTDLPDIYNLISPRRILAINPLKPDNFEELKRKIEGVDIRQDASVDLIAEEIGKWLTTV